jgi:hypothetical protein
MTPPEADIRAELEPLAAIEPTSGRAATARASAIRQLAALDRRARATSLDELVDDDGRFHLGGPEWWDLDRCHSDETRERWRPVVVACPRFRSA